MIFVRTPRTFAIVIAFSSPAGRRMSQSIPSTSSRPTGVVSARPLTAPVVSLCRSAAWTEMPRSLWTAPRESAMAMTRAPSASTSRATLAPALPKPWTTTRAPLRFMPRTRHASRNT